MHAHALALACYAEVAARGRSGEERVDCVVAGGVLARERG